MGFNLLNILFLRYWVVVFMFVCYSATIYSRDDVFQKSIHLERQASTLYSLLNQISGQSGFYFVYDTEIVNSDKRVRVREESKPMMMWLEEILGDPDLEFNVIENHILIFKTVKREAVVEDYGHDIDSVGGVVDEADELIIEGRVLDENTRNPLPFATVAVKGEFYGITTNSDGYFKLKVSGDQLESRVVVSHIGYNSQHLPVKIFKESNLDVLMKTEYIPIQEVLIRYYDPIVIIRAALDRIKDNYNQHPVYLYSFYREGVHRNEKIINYSEAFFQVYKTPYDNFFEQDQVRLLQSRTITHADQTDTLVLKIRAGVQSSLYLDIVKNIPNFLDLDYLHNYEFTKADIASIDGRRAYAIAFEQKRHITQPLYKGILYIDMETLAFLSADFEVHPKYIGKAHDQFRARRNRNYRAEVVNAVYSVNYVFYNGYYYLNHVRADLSFRYRKRFHIFSNRYDIFIEMVTSRIDTENVQGFKRSEAINKNRVFMDGEHDYDPDFWDGYTIITPEQSITQGLSKIRSRIESVVTEPDADEQ